MTLERFIEQGHILVTERGDETGAVDEGVRELGLARRVLVTVPVVSLVPMLLAEGDALATVGRLAADRLARMAALSRFDLPIPMRPWHMNLIWSTRRAQDPGLVWLREALKGIAQGG